MKEVTMKDLELIVAHLLGGTSGLNLSTNMTDVQIREMVSSAFRVAIEICHQTEEFKFRYFGSNKADFDK